jgi:hypothetical protein
MIVPPVASGGPATWQRLVPEVRSPRLFRASDIPRSQDRDAFVADGWTSMFSTDLDRDGSQEVIAAGRGTTQDAVFLAIFTRTGREWRRVLLVRPAADLIGLRYTEHPDPVLASRGHGAVMATFTAFPSDDYVIVYWQDGRYRVVGGPEIIERVTEDLRRAP